jgi:lipoyl(octanoyl) transferase
METIGVVVFCVILGLIAPSSTAWISSQNHLRKESAPKLQTTRLQIGPQQLGEFEALRPSRQREERQVQFFDFASSGELIQFEDAWEFQKKILEDHVKRLSLLREEDPASQFLGDSSELWTTGLDTVIMLQHNPVYTLGTGSDEEFIISRNSDNKVPVVRMDRGGEVHCHCPGQLTMYGILDLRGYRQDIHWYMRALEEAVILALSKCGLDRAERQDDITGVWVDNCKVAAVGIKCRKWITMHGLSVNIERDSVKNFAGIVPCGLVGKDVGCLNQFLETPISVAGFSVLLQEALEEVFQIELQHVVGSEERDFSTLLKKTLE